jgi:hypothetical protein
MVSLCDVIRRSKEHDRRAVSWLPAMADHPIPISYALVMALVRCCLLWLLPAMLLSSCWRPGRHRPAWH